MLRFSHQSCCLLLLLLLLHKKENTQNISNSSSYQRVMLFALRRAQCGVSRTHLLRDTTTVVVATVAAAAVANREKTTVGFARRTSCFPTVVSDSHSGYGEDARRRGRGRGRGAGRRRASSSFSAFSSSSASSMAAAAAAAAAHHPSAESVEKATVQWLENFIIAENVCPFAKNVRQEEKSMKIVVCEHENIELVLEDFIGELRQIAYDSNEEGITKTVLFVISPKCEFVNDFDNFLDFANIIDDAALQNGDARGESVLDQLDLRGKVQVVSFHPDFIFSEEKLGDPGAFTNRAPYPLLHILREKDVTEAVNSHPNVRGIPKANVERMREIGNESLKRMLDGLRSL